jgi:predicted dehydrogenase
MGGPRVLGCAACFGCAVPRVEAECGLRYDEPMRRKLRWGILGTWEIAADFATAVATSDLCSVVNVVGSSASRARQFAERFELPSYASSIAGMLREDGVEAVYIATPNSLHEEQVIAALQAGKHVLCEKPTATCAAGVERILSVARESSGFFMEGMMYRCHPLLPTLIEQLSSGVIGAIRHARADFGFRVAREAKPRLFSVADGGGGILDVGCYAVSLVRLLAGLSAGKPFLEPVRLSANGEIGPTGVDERASCLLQFQTGFTAEVSCSLRHQLGTRVEVFGDLGSVVIPNVWLPSGQRHGLESSFTIQREGEAPTAHRVAAERSVFALEAESVLNSLPQRQARWPLPSWEDSLGNQRVLDAWRAEVYSGRS